MPHNWTNTRLPRLLASLAAVLLCWGAAFSLEYQAKIAGQQRTVNAPVLELNGVEYLSVDAFCQALDGSCSAIASQTRVGFGEHSAILIYQESEVHSSLGSFMLANPIIRHEGATYVARQDIAPLFKKGFDIDIQQGTAGLAPIAPPEMEALTPMDEPTPEPSPEEEPTPEEPQPVDELPQEEPEPAPVSSGAVAQLSLSAIVVDAGHGGRDVGYTANNGLSEKDLALKLSERLVNLLKENTNAKIYATRREDKDISNSERARTAVENAGSVFISIHAGVSRSPQANGTDIYFADAPTGTQAGGAPSRRDGGKTVEESRALANAIATAFQAAGLNVRHVRQAPLRLLRDVAMPGILVEVGYLSNPAEAELLMQDAHLDKIAQGILTGIQQAAAQEKAQP